MAEHFELDDEIRAAIGQNSTPWTFEVTATSVRAFAHGAGYTDPVYFDEDAALGKSDADGEKTVDLEVWTLNEDGKKTTPGEVTVVFLT